MYNVSTTPQISLSKSEGGILKKVTHVASVIIAVLALIIILLLGLSVAAGLVLPAAVLLGFCKLIWMGAFGCIYSNLYLRHLGWLHAKWLKYNGRTLPVKYIEVPGYSISQKSEKDDDTDDCQYKAHVFAIANFTNNYCWLVVEAEDGVPVRGFLIDPGDSDMVMKRLHAISRKSFYGTPIKITAILTTHHHWDHMYANLTLEKELLNAKLLSPENQEHLHIYSSIHDQVVNSTHKVKDGDRFFIGRCEIEAIGAPCHTKGHIMFFVGGKILFSGDTLFNGASGAPFEGTKIETTRNHATIIERCSMDTIVYPGHEYSSLMKDILTDDTTLAKPTSFFSAASAFYRANHSTTCSHPDVPITMVSDLLLTTPEFAKVYRHAAGLAQVMYCTVCDEIRENRTLSELPRKVLAEEKLKSRGDPFTTLFTVDVEKLIEELKGDKVSATDAGNRLQKLISDWDESVALPHYFKDCEMSDEVITPSDTLREALLVLGTRPPQRIVSRFKFDCCDKLNPEIHFDRVLKILSNLNLGLRLSPNTLLSCYWDKAFSKSEKSKLLSFSSALADNSRQRLDLLDLVEFVPSDLDINSEEVRATAPDVDLRMVSRDDCPICPHSFTRLKSVAPSFQRAPPSSNSDSLAALSLCVGEN